MERITTGIIGLDKYVGGGYPKNSVILISGGPGTAKTTFSLQYIYKGANISENGVYISFEQEPKDLKESVKEFCMDFYKLEKKKK